MYLRGIHFPPVMNAAGANGFFGEGYWYHRYWKVMGLTFRNCGFIAKTTTWQPRPGNMPLLSDGITPKEWKPKCIKVKFVKGVVLNAVGLSGPGAEALFVDGRWQQRQEPFMISFMALGDLRHDRRDQVQRFVARLYEQLPRFQAPVGLEINYSCPNVGQAKLHFVQEVQEDLTIANCLGIPLQLKLSALTAPQIACDIARHPACDAITMSNTIPWGKLEAQINWYQLFRQDHSPLYRYKDGGGLSGWPLTPVVCRWIQHAKERGLNKPMWASGGIYSCRAIKSVFEAGASGVQLGTVAILRPWRMRAMIALANKLFT